jgi:hypothetical protein
MQLVVDLGITRAQKRNYAMAEGFHPLNYQNKSWSLFLRYQAQADLTTGWPWRNWNGSKPCARSYRKPPNDDLPNLNKFGRTARRKHTTYGSRNEPKCHPFAGSGARGDWPSAAAGDQLSVPPDQTGT